MNPFLMELLSRILGSNPAAGGVAPFSSGVFTSGVHSVRPGGIAPAPKPAAPLIRPMPAVRPVAPPVIVATLGSQSRIAPGLTMPNQPPLPLPYPGNGGQTGIGHGGGIAPTYPTDPSAGSITPTMGPGTGNGVPARPGSWAPFTHNPNAELGGWGVM